MKRRWTLGAAILLAATMMGAPLAAQAEDPVSFDSSSQIVDTVGALGSDTSKVEDSLSSLYAETQMQLFVAYVDSFTNPADAEDWATTTANANGLGDNDYLLVVAVDDRNYFFSVSQGSPLSVQQTDDIQFDRIEPMLAQDRWADAAIAASDGLKATTVSASFPPIWVLLLGVVVVGAIIFFIVRSRRKAAVVASKGAGAGGSLAPGAPAGPPPATTEELKRSASRALVHTDDAIKSSTEELGFAVAQYGAEATTPFKAALDQAKALLNQAFQQQQKLDDVTPDTEEQVRAWYTEIADLCEQANQLLDDQADAFADLRKLEKDAPAALARTQDLAGQVTDRVDGARRALAELGQQYTLPAVAAIAENPNQAEERISFARFSLKAASEQLAAADTAEAAVGIRAAEEAVSQAAQLISAVDKLGADLHTAKQSLAPAIANLESDVAAAQALSTDAASTGMAAIVANTQQAIASARVAGPSNPLELMTIVEAANTQIDGALEGVRTAQEKAERTRASLDMAITSARSSVSAAEEYITTRRGAVDSVARTRLAEAGRLLVEAEQLRATDAPAAQQRATRAASLAADALSYAQQDVSGWGAETGGSGEVGGFLDGLFDGGGSYGGSRSRGSDGGDVLGAILGGLLSGNGGSSRSSGSSRSGGSIFGGGSSSRRPSSFGGSRSSGRRGGGGRF